MKITNNQLAELDRRFASAREPSGNASVLRVFRFAEGTVTVYKTLTLLVQGSGATAVQKAVNEALNLKNPAAAKPQGKPAAATAGAKKTPSGHGELGADEVGVGDYFGPVVAAAAYLTPEGQKIAVALGVKDSKALTDSKMEQLAKDFARFAKIKVAVCWPEEYNRMIANGLTAHHVKTHLHNQAINTLLAEIGATRPTVVLDAFASDKNFARYSRELNEEAAPVDVFATQAESKYPAVAVASIAARVAFIKAVRKLEKDCGHRLPLGASNVVTAAREILASVGYERFAKLAKLHFKTTQQVVAKA